jgi:hypothetical protein
VELGDSVYVDLDNSGCVAFSKRSGGASISEWQAVAEAAEDFNDLIGATAAAAPNVVTA